MIFDEVFRQLYIEATFKQQTTKHQEILNAPMFTFYRDVNKPEVEDYRKDKLAEVAKLARAYITKIGFPSMHANVVFKDFKNSKNTPDVEKAGGYAYGNPKFQQEIPTKDEDRYTTRHIALKYDDLKHIDLSKQHMFALAKLLVHEWAHLWMFNNRKSFTEACERFYDNILHSQAGILRSRGGLTDPVTPQKVHTALSKLIGWVNEYGMTNSRELWATGVEHFFKLPKDHQKRILSLMSGSY